MANRYIIQGATYNGDGTTSSEAASAGAAGAWNHIDIITGAALGFGTLSAGDTVYIRSKTGNGANANITTTVASGATYGSASATEASPITWILDAGAVWSGISGTLTHTATGAGTTGHVLRNYNIYISTVQDSWKFTCDSTWFAYPILTTNGSQSRNLFFDSSPGISASHQLGGASLSLHVNLHLKLKNLYSDPIGYPLLMLATNYCSCDLINPTIELSDTVTTTTQALVNTNNSTSLRITGGEIKGAGADTGGFQLWYSVAGGSVFLDGFRIPRLIAQTVFPVVSASGTRSQLSAVGLDSVLGALYVDAVGSFDSRSDGNYPTLNAVLPTSGSTPWSWKAYPKAASRISTMAINATKLYVSAAATKTATVELLVSTDFAGLLNASNVWIDVTYTDDSTGTKKTVSTFDAAAGALTSSSASWSASTYGAISLTKYKFAITTPTSIKQDTLVHAVLSWGVPATTTTKIFFVCPDVQLT